MDVEEYASLVSYNNYQKEKYMAYVRAILTPNCETSSMVETIGDTAFILDNAAGDQLDVIGELVGVDRLLTFVPLIGDREMSDDEYKVAILLKIARNTWDGTTLSAIKIYQRELRNIAQVEVYDDGTCHVVVNIYTSGTTRIAEILNATGTLMIPAGVGVSVNVVDNDVTIEFGASTSPYGMLSVVTAQTVPTHRYFVRDIEQFDVEDLEEQYTRVIET